jgi:hypothetical protein
VQSVECSNVGKLTRAALIIDRMQQCAALMIERTALESVSGAGLLWSVTTRSNIPQTATLDTYDFQFVVRQ